eukprot:3493156-Amphidinium_carterae.2
MSQFPDVYVWSSIALIPVIIARLRLCHEPPSMLVSWPATFPTHAEAAGADAQGCAQSLVATYAFATLCVALQSTPAQYS